MPNGFASWSKPFLRQTGRSTSTHATAAAAWKSYQVASDEAVEIIGLGGRGWMPIQFGINLTFVMQFRLTLHARGGGSDVAATE